MRLSHHATWVAIVWSPRLNNNHTNKNKVLEKKVGSVGAKNFENLCLGTRHVSFLIMV